MKQHWKKLLLSGVVVVVAAVLLWPIPFPSLETGDDVSVTHSYFWIDNTDPSGSLKQTHKSYLCSADPDTLAQLEDILSRYSYHRCLHTLFPFLAVGSDGSHHLLFHLAGDLLVLTNHRHLYAGERIYCLGYLGDSTADTLVQELLETLETAPESVSP